MRIRPATQTDVAPMSALANRAFSDAYGASSDLVDLRRHLADYFGESAIESELGKPGVTYLVADDDGVLAGMLKLRDADRPDLVPSESAIEVQQLYVDTRLQRGGVGRHLMARAVEEAMRLKSDGLWLSVWTEADWATSFYRKCGFRALGELEFRLGSTRYVDYLMWLALRD